jgi:PhnB protein
MAGDEMWRSPDVVPSITYTEVPRAVEWLERVFGFRERVEARLSWPGGGLTWVEVGDSLFSVGTPDETWPNAASPGPSCFVMKIYVDDIDGHFARATAEGVTIVSEPQDGFWGGRTYRALDHEGNRWEISQRGRDLAPERWRLPPGVRRGVSK